MSDTVLAPAKVTVTIEVPVGGSWGEKCDLAQVYDQAIEEALGWVERHIYRDGGRIVGKPSVIAVLVPRKT